MVKLLHDAPVLVEIDANELSDRLDPESYYTTYLHKKGSHVPTTELVKLVDVYSEKTNPKKSDNSYNYVDLVNIDSNFGTVIPDTIHSKNIIGSRQIFHSRDILFSRIRPYLKRIGLVPDNISEGICSNEFHVLVTKNNTKPYYLLVMLRSTYCVSQAQKTTGSTRPRLEQDKLERMKIPQLSEDAQKKIDYVMGKALSILISSRNEINEIKNILENKLEELLPTSKLQKSVIINPNDLQRFDPEFHTVKNWIKKFPVTKVSLLPLGKLAKLSEQTVNPENFPDQEFRYVEIQDINIRTGQIDSYSTVLGRKAAGRARRPMEEGQIMVSTTRPHRGAIAIVPEYHHHDIASTGFQLFNVNDNSITEYLHSVLRNNFCLIQLWGRSTGTGYPEISPDEISDILIPQFSDPDPAVISNKIRESLNKCYVSKITIKELEMTIEKRLENEITDVDIIRVCDDLNYNMNEGKITAKSIHTLNFIQNKLD